MVAHVALSHGMLSYQLHLEQVLAGKQGPNSRLLGCELLSHSTTSYHSFDNLHRSCRQKDSASTILISLPGNTPARNVAIACGSEGNGPSGSTDSRMQVGRVFREDKMVRVSSSRTGNSAISNGTPSCRCDNFGQCLANATRLSRSTVAVTGGSGSRDITIRPSGDTLTPLDTMACVKENSTRSGHPVARFLHITLSSDAARSYSMMWCKWEKTSRSSMEKVHVRLSMPGMYIRHLGRPMIMVLRDDSHPLLDEIRAISGRTICSHDVGVIVKEMPCSALA